MFKTKLYLAVGIVGILTLAAGACAQPVPLPAPVPTPTPAPTPAPAPPVKTEEANFRFLISDEVNAIEDFQNLFVTISSIGVQRGGESGNWLEFRPDITEVDLKPLVGENALEIYSGNLTPGEYSKVFIYVSEVEGILADNATADVKLPSKKLQISKPFVISDNTTTSFVYDVTVVKAGKSGQYILKPQIAQSGAAQKFKEVKPKEGKGEKPEKPEESEFKGTIETIDGSTWTVNIEEESRTVDVSKAEIEGQPDVGLHVKIEGILENGNIVAKEVEIEEAETQEEEAALQGTIWVLESYGDPDSLNAVLEDTEITIEFISAEGKFQGSAGCNSYFGGYEVSEDKLTIGSPIGSTMMACPGPIMNQEQEYLSILEAAESYKIEGDQLSITCGDKVLIFQRQ